MPEPAAGIGSTSDGRKQPPAKVLFGRYEVGRLLGCGAFAKVYHGRHIASGQSVAIKCLSKPRVLRGDLAPSVRREIAALHRLHHPHVVRLFEVLATRSKIYFVLEFVRGGELFARVSRGRLPEDLTRRLFHQLVSAIAFCHSRGVYHRDLKPENLLLDYGDAGSDGIDSVVLKISDFGLSAASEHLRADGLLHTLCGTPAYVAPEVLSKRGYDGAKVDVWSCGVILFVLNTGYLPFNDPNLMNLYRKIYRGEYRCPKWTSPELRRLIGRLLDTNPVTRITVDGILRDPWFRRGLEEEKLVSMMRFREEIEEKIAKPDDDRDLNAFDIISFSSGLDLSGIVGAVPERERFLAGEGAEAILGRAEEVGKEEGLVVRRRRGRGGCGAAVEGRRGGLVAWVEVYRIAGELVVVEVERGEEAGSRWGGEFWKERLLRSSPVGSSDSGGPGSGVHQPEPEEGEPPDPGS